VSSLYVAFVDFLVVCGAAHIAALGWACALCVEIQRTNSTLYLHDLFEEYSVVKVRSRTSFQYDEVERATSIQVLLTSLDGHNFAEIFCDISAKQSLWQWDKFSGNWFDFLLCGN